MNTRAKATLSDIEKCMAGKCMGAFCPCLCHTSLKYDHAALAARNARGPVRRKRGARPRARTVLVS